MSGLRFLLLVSLMFALVGTTTLTSGTSTIASSAPPVMAITVTNNSGRDIYHMYLSPTDHDAWGPDLLSETIIRTGESFTINDLSCGANEIKVIAEDKEGCFTYGVVGCAQNATNWTITNDMPRDCGN